MGYRFPVLSALNPPLCVVSSRNLKQRGVPVGLKLAHVPVSPLEFHGFDGAIFLNKKGLEILRFRHSSPCLSRDTAESVGRRIRQHHKPGDVLFNGKPPCLLSGSVNTHQSVGARFPHKCLAALKTRNQPPVFIDRDGDLP